MVWDGVPEKVTLVNMHTQDARAVQYNPEQLVQAIGVTYADLTVVGLSHKRSHFINLENGTFRFDLHYRAIGRGPEEYDEIRRSERFLKSLAHPIRGTTIDLAGPPRVLFIWPELISLTCKIKSLEFTYTNFRLQGGPIAFTVATVLEEIRDVFVSSEDILDLGDERGGGLVNLGDV